MIRLSRSVGRLWVWSESVLIEKYREKELHTWASKGLFFPFFPWEVPTVSPALEGSLYGDPPTVKVFFFWHLFFCIAECETSVLCFWCNVFLSRCLYEYCMRTVVIWLNYKNSNAWKYHLNPIYSLSNLNKGDRKKIWVYGTDHYENRKNIPTSAHSIVRLCTLSVFW